MVIMVIFWRHFRTPRDGIGLSLVKCSGEDLSCCCHSPKMVVDVIKFFGSKCKYSQGSSKLLLLFELPGDGVVTDILTTIEMDFI